MKRLEKQEEVQTFIQCPVKTDCRNKLSRCQEIYSSKSLHLTTYMFSYLDVEASELLLFIGVNFTISKVICFKSVTTGPGSIMER